MKALFKTLFTKDQTEEMPKQIQTNNENKKEQSHLHQRGFSNQVYTNPLFDDTVLDKVFPENRNVNVDSFYQKNPDTMPFNNDNARTHCVNMEPGNYYQPFRHENRMGNLGNYNIENHVRNNHNMHQHNPDERRNNPYGYKPRDEYINLRRTNNGP